MNRELLKQLEIELSNITPDFRHTKLYKLLKDKLSYLGYWKQAPRGNPKKGFNRSDAAQQQAQFKSMLKDMPSQQANSYID